jgi:iron complex transport system substrate-binding protein
MSNQPRPSTALFPQRTTRRRLLGTTAGLAAGAAIFTRTGAQGGTPVAGGDWTFTDDRGTTVTLATQPVNIAADLSIATALWDFGVRPVAVSGWNASGTGENDAAWGNIDRDAVEIISGEAGDPDLEKLIGLGIDLFVTLTWYPGDPENPNDYWGFSDFESRDRTAEIVPIVAISASGHADANTQRVGELAALLGADLAAPELAEQHAAFEAAMAEFEQVTAEKADITSLYIYGEAETLYVANPGPWADLTMFQAHGQNIVIPDVAEGEYWHPLSWEEALMYPADVVYNTTRGDAFTADDLKSHPTFGQHPAIKAGQIGVWNQDFIMSDSGLAETLTTILETLRTAEKVTE